MIAGDDADRTEEGSELTGQIRCSRTQLAGRRTEKITEPSGAPEQIDQFTALIRGTEHHHPAQISQRFFSEKAAEKNSAHGMGNKMDGADPSLPQLRYRGRNAELGQGLDKVSPRRIPDIDHRIPLPP